MAKRPTINDVARHAGVSKSTVSLVLQNSPLVKKQTRITVEESIYALKYVYNRSAANLGGSANDLIGLVINDLRNPFFTQFTTSTQMALSKHGYATVIANTNEDAEIQKQVIASMLEHGVSAFVISPSYGDEGSIFDTIARTNTPALQVLRRLDNRTELFPYYSMDYEEGGKIAMEHLIGRGAKNIAFVGGLEDRPVTAERIKGYYQIIEENDLTPLTFLGHATRSFGWDMAIEITKNYPEVDAVLCFNDMVALGMLSGFASKNVKVGEDILLIGIDDIEECNMVYPRLSSVRCDIEQFGVKTADFIVEWLENGIKPQPVYREPVKLIPRQSSCGI